VVIPGNMLKKEEMPDRTPPFKEMLEHICPVTECAKGSLRKSTLSKGSCSTLKLVPPYSKSTVSAS